MYCSIFGCAILFVMTNRNKLDRKIGEIINGNEQVCRNRRVSVSWKKVVYRRQYCNSFVVSKQDFLFCCYCFLCVFCVFLVVESIFWKLFIHTRGNMEEWVCQLFYRLQVRSFRQQNHPLDFFFLFREWPDWLRVVGC